MRRLSSVVLVLLIGSASMELDAQQTVPRSTTSHDQATPQATAKRLTGTIHIDGILNEPQWRTAEPLSQLTQLDPQEGKPATEPSDIRFMYDDDALYIGAMLYDRHA